MRSWWWSVDWGHWQSSSVSPGWQCRAAGDDAGTTDFPSDARRQFAATNTDSQSPAEHASQRIPRHRTPPTAHRRYILHRLQPILHCISNPPPPHHNHFTALFPGHPGEPVPEENFWTLWCKGRLTEADTLTIQLGATPSGLTSAHFHHPPLCLE